MEIARRLIYYGACFAAILSAMYACLEPVVIIDIYDPLKDSRSSARRYAESLLSEEDQAALANKRKGEIEANTVNVYSREWDEIYNQLKYLKEGGQVPARYKKRMPSDRHPMSVFFFRQHELNLDSIPEYLKSDNQQLYLKLVGTERYLKLDYRVYSKEDFHLGSGFSRYPRPPVYMLYPYRQYSIWIFLFGLALYIFLPVRFISPDAIRYPRWRVMLGDLAASIMTFVFFGMPFLIVGSVVHAVVPYFVLTAVFWLISLLGVYSIKIALWYASYQVRLANDGIDIATYRGIRHFSFSDMEYFQPVIFKPPKWLIVLMWIAALSGRGAAGRAILTSTSEAGSIGIRLKNRADLFIVVTDQMGTTALKGFEKIIDALRSAGVSQKDEVRQIRSTGFEIMRLPKE